MRRLGLVALLAGAVLAGCGDDGRPTPKPGKPVVLKEFENDFLPRGVAVDGKGTVYTSGWDGKRFVLVAFPKKGKSTRRPIPCSTGQGADQDPYGSLAAAPDGTLYWSMDTQYRVVRLHPDGTGECFAGTGEKGLSGDGGPATAAKLGEVWSMALDSERGDLYVNDVTNNVVRKVDRSGTITTTVPKGGPTGADPAVGVPWVAFDSRRGLLYGREAAGITVRDRDGKVQLIPGTDLPLKNLAAVPGGGVFTTLVKPKCGVVRVGLGGDVRSADTGDAIPESDCPRHEAVDGDGNLWVTTDYRLIGVAPPG